MLSCYSAALLGFFHLYPCAIYQTVIIVVFLKYSDLLTIKKRMNLDYLAYYLVHFCYLAYCAMFPGLFHPCLHMIYKIVLIVNYWRYFDRLTMKELINLDSLPYCCNCAILLLCDVFFIFMPVYNSSNSLFYRFFKIFWPINNEKTDKSRPLSSLWLRSRLLSSPFLLSGLLSGLLSLFSLLFTLL